ncbi:MAG: cadmium-translocating P-type ATPase [Gorillibacterium sp.]|nr:cadmium-translocating P-type ATPase [Gorillibacterium sp.]
MEQAVVTEREGLRSLSNLWKQHRALMIATLSLIFIILAWLMGKNDAYLAEVIFFVLAYVTGGYQKAWEGFTKLFKERDLDVDLLMVIAAVGAASIGYWMDGAILIFIFSLSGALEEYTMERTNHEITSIMQLRPEEAFVVLEGIERKVKVEQLEVGQIVLVRPGERIPADGRIVEGQSAVDQASITGESLPIDKAVDDEVFAGTINGQGALKISVTKPAGETLLSRIIHLVQEAKNEMPPSQLFVERFEGIYAKIVVLSALLLMTIPPFLLDWTWDKTIYRAMIFLVVASPCALVSSIMPAILAGISNAARKGVLFKGGIHLEQIGNVAVVAFDKTGTLTEGKPKVTDIHTFQEYSESALLILAASLEHLSEHPIAKAIVHIAKDKGLVLEPASELQAVTGLGVHGLVSGVDCRIGKRGLLIGLQMEPEQVRIAKELEADGKTVIFVEAGGLFIGILAVQDTLRANAEEAVAALKKMNKRVVMLTGDSLSTAQVIGKQAGVDEVYAELLPEHKVDIIKKLTAEYGKVAMIGDGVNDAPALATASVGIAMGAAGTDVALETANVVLMADDISKIPYAISLGLRTSRVIKQNVSFAIAVIILLVLTNFLGGINLPSGVVGHEGSTLVVIISGLRLLR